MSFAIRRERIYPSADRRRGEASNSAQLNAPDLEGSYGVRPRGDGFTNDDGEEISKEQLPASWVQYITGAKDGGAEWGWEFKLSGDG